MFLKATAINCKITKTIMMATIVGTKGSKVFCVVVWGDCSAETIVVVALLALISSNQVEILQV